MSLTHFNRRGEARMVDISGKEESGRYAIAHGRVTMKRETVRLIENGDAAKGDVLAVARLAGIMGAKKTADLIPLCHPVALHGVELELTVGDDGVSVDIIATTRTQGRTGVEMEGLTAVSVAALTIYDMLKAVDREMILGPFELKEKRGGKSGHFVREHYAE